MDTFLGFRKMITNSVAPEPEGSSLISQEHATGPIRSQQNPLYTPYTSGIQPEVREDTLRLSFLSFKTYYLIHYFGCNLFYLY
jgi:hypothetical protein